MMKAIFATFASLFARLFLVQIRGLSCVSQFAEKNIRLTDEYWVAAELLCFQFVIKWPLLRWRPGPLAFQILDREGTVVMGPTELPDGDPHAPLSLQVAA